MSTGEREPMVVRGVLFAAWPASLEAGPSWACWSRTAMCSWSASQVRSMCQWRPAVSRGAIENKA